jgi:hypothetical protein
MSFFFNGREEPAGFNLPGYKRMRKRVLRIPNPKTEKNFRFKIKRKDVPHENDLKTVRNLEFKDWIGLPRSQDNGYNPYILVMP